MYPRGNSRSATATPTGSPKRRLPQIPGQGLPTTAHPSASSRMGGVSSRLRGAEGGGMHASYHTSYDGGLNNGQRGQNLHPSTRSRSMGHYGGYSDTEVMLHPASTDPQRYYDAGGGMGRAPLHSGYPSSGPVPGGQFSGDPYYENMRTQGPHGAVPQGPVGPMGPMPPVSSQAGMGVGGYPVEDRRAQPPPPPPRNVNFEGDPPIKSSGGPRGAPPIGRSLHYGDSDMESVTSALSSHSAPHQRPRRPG